MPKISIIVPVYKVEEYLCRCLDSIVAQTFTDWECILVDDGSPDNSGAICDEYAEKDKRFRVFHQENAGVSTARNRGLDEARGEWIDFMDSDDWVEKEMLKELYKCAIDNQAEVVVSGISFSNGIKNYKNFIPNLGWLNMPKDFKWYIQGPCAKLFLRTFLHKNNIRFPKNLTLAEDLYFTFQAYFKSKKIFGINKSFYNYFQNENSVVHTLNLKNINDAVFVLTMIDKYLTENNVTNWDNWLIEKKIEFKNYYIYNLNNVHCDLWRNTFASVNFICIKQASIKKKILYYLILMHFDWIVKFRLNRNRIQKN